MGLRGLISTLIILASSANVSKIVILTVLKGVLTFWRKNKPFGVTYIRFGESQTI